MLIIFLKQIVFTTLGFIVYLALYKTDLLLSDFILLLALIAGVQSTNRCVTVLVTARLCATNDKI